jgi:Flp pilus assembly protein TadB
MKARSRQTGEHAAEEGREAVPDDGGRDEEATTSGGRFAFEQAWLVVACALLVVAASLLYLGHPDAAFVTAALGVSAWFLNLRDGLKRKYNLVKRSGRNWESRSDGDDDDGSW